MQSFWLLIHKLVDWITRPRSIAKVLVSSGTLLFLASLASGYEVKAVGVFGSTTFDIQVDTASGVINGLSYVGVVIAILLFFWGFFLIYKDDKALKRRRIIVIEQRGLFDLDTPLATAVALCMKGTIDALTINVREGVQEGKITKPEIALKKVVTVKEDLLRRLEGQNRSDFDVVYGGLMAVPLTFITGVLLDDESVIKIFDWDRTSPGRWRELEKGTDDGQRLQVISDLVGEPEEAVLAVSFSYSVDIEAIQKTFGEIPIMHLKMSELSSNTHWSEEKQAALSNQFMDALKAMAAKGVKKIHLIISAPNSVVFNFGRIYDRRNLPSAVVYQYEKSDNPAYPWGVLLPTHGIIEPTIIHVPVRYE